mmetsp:Transcript_32657/g.96081  ORF Transcript_32657/g.96081 Transcript_32657/m.96081 type:complete len:213 (+) Transcript_32657:843-1481(+)
MERMARGSSSSVRRADESLSKARAMARDGVWEMPKPPVHARAESKPLRVLRTDAGGTARWRSSSHRADCVAMECLAAGAASHTTACTIAPSLKRRVSALGPHSRVNAAAAASSPGVGPRSTSPEQADASRCKPTSSSVGAGAADAGGHGGSGARHARTRVARPPRPRVSTCSAAAQSASGREGGTAARSGSALSAAGGVAVSGGGAKERRAS